MSQILLLHSALGRRPAMHSLAEALGELGHDVVVPDYYDGEVFATEAEGIAHRDRIGAAALFARLQATIADLDDDAVLAGLSLGAAFAQRLARDRPTAQAVILLHSAAAPRGPWSGQPVQLHRYAEDPWVDEDDVAALAKAVRASGAAYEDWVTPGRGHLFTDPDTPDGDAAATAATVRRLHAFLGAVDD